MSQMQDDELTLLWRQGTSEEPDNEEIAPGGLRLHRQARLATGQDQRGPQRERDTHADVFPAPR